MNSDEAHRRAEALFKKERQLRETQPTMAEYQAELRAMREKTARLRALRLARAAANQKTPPADGKGVA
jgi:Tfp pilus assembly protein FimV